MFPNTGGVGALGVIKSMRKQGIGLALAAKTTEVIQSNGADYSFVGWTWLKDWYGKLGYKVWHSYQEGHLSL